MKCIAGSNPKSTIERLTSFIEEEGVDYSQRKTIYKVGCSGKIFNYTTTLLRILFPLANIEWVYTPAFLDENGLPLISKTRLYTKENINSNKDYFKSVKKLYIFACVRIITTENIALGIRGVFKT